jgi:hypothetical protein
MDLTGEVGSVCASGEFAVSREVGGEGVGGEGGDGPERPFDWMEEWLRMPLTHFVGRDHNPPMTDFELAKLVGARATDVRFGAPPSIPTRPGTLEHPFVPIHVTLDELNQGVMPTDLAIVRRHPSGQVQTLNLATAYREQIPPPKPAT